MSYCGDALVNASCLPSNCTICNEGNSDTYLSSDLCVGLGFLTLFVIFLCVTCLSSDDNNGSSTTTDVNESIVRKKVLPHGQASKDESSEGKNRRRRLFQCCLFRNGRKGSSVTPIVSETAKEVLDRYRQDEKIKCQGRVSLPRSKSNTPSDTSENERSSDDLYVSDDVLAEEGRLSCTDMSQENLCSICLNPFKVDEEVAWSKLKHCRHVFHYECILPWAVQGHVKCPICRETFWSKDRRTPNHFSVVERFQWRRWRWPCQVGKTLDVDDGMNQSIFCVIHGRSSCPELENNETTTARL